MGVTNTGIYRLGQLVQGKSSLYPSHIAFGTGTDAFTGEETVGTGSDFLRKLITWEDNGLFSKYTVELSSVEANGSEINSLSLFDGADIGSNNMWMYDQTFIGSKNNTFNVQIEGEFYIRRPTT